jgi:vacuolar protein sorting-associated protein 41
MPQLGSSRARMCSYLHEVFQRDARVAASYHDMQLELYADHNPQQLLPFLRKSSEYSPDVAFKLCRAREFVPEQVFLLARLGNVSEALLLLLRRMRDVKAAVDFCLEHQDGQLWDTLINSCFDDAALIPPLLDCIGVHPQPLRVVSRIPLGVEIAGLKEKVVMHLPRRLPSSFGRFSFTGFGFRL